MPPKSALAKKLPLESAAMAEPLPLDGFEIEKFAQLNNLHLTEISTALGVNTVALYSKKKNASQLSSTVSILLRLYSAFPEYIPRTTPPEPEELIARITSIDRDFKRGHFGPLLGLETNSSFRLVKGVDKAGQTVRQLLVLIDQLLSASSENWKIIKEAVEVEAAATKIIPASQVWSNGGWSKAKARAKSSEPVTRPRLKSDTAKPLLRRSTEANANDPGTATD